MNSQTKNSYGTKRSLLEDLHRMRYIVIIAFLVTGGYLIFISISKGFFGIVIAIILAAFLWTFAKSLIHDFSTTHNMGQLSFGDTLLGKTFHPGDLIILLPGYTLVEYKYSQLLDTNELSMEVKEKEMQYKQDDIKNPKGKDSVTAKNVNVNYYLDKFGVYGFIKKAPKEYNNALIENIVADIAKAFEKRICTLEEAQSFTDFVYIDPKNPRGDMNIPEYVKEPGFYIYIDEVKGEKWPEFITGKSGDGADTSLLYLPELNSTLERARVYGIHFVNITIEDFEDSKKNDELRNSIRQQEFINEKKDKATEKRRDLINQYRKDFEAAGFTQKEAVQMAREEVAKEEGSRKEYAGGSNLLINPEKMK